MRLNTLDGIPRATPETAYPDALHAFVDMPEHVAELVDDTGQRTARVMCAALRYQCKTNKLFRQISVMRRGEHVYLTKPGFGYVTNNTMLHFAPTTADALDKEFADLTEKVYRLSAEKVTLLGEIGVLKTSRDHFERLFTKEHNKVLTFREARD